MNQQDQPDDGVEMTGVTAQLLPVSPSAGSSRKGSGDNGLDGEDGLESHGLEADTQSLCLARVCLLMSPNVPDEIQEIKDKGNWYFYTTVIYAIFLQIVNVLIQIGITYILLLDVEKEENSWESQSFQRNDNMTLNGAIELLSTFASPKEDPNAADGIPSDIWEKCQHQTKHSLRHLSFYYFMIFVWVTRMFHEGLSSCMLAMRILKVRTPPAGTDSYFDVTSRAEDKLAGVPKPKENKNRVGLDLSGKSVKTQKSDTSFHIVYLTVGMKVTLVLSVVFMRLLVAIMITYAGCKFIMLQCSYEKVVLKALCMQWVIQIDELLVKSFTTNACRTLIGKVKLRHEKFISQPWWEHAVGGPILFTLGSSGVLFVCLGLFGPLMGFRSECLRVTGVGYRQSMGNEFLHELAGLFH